MMLFVRVVIRTFKKLFLFFNNFKSKKSLIDYIDELEGIIDRCSWQYIGKIEDLKQNKVYNIVVDTSRECKDVSFLISKLKHSIKWTLPNILITTSTFKELTNKEIRELKKQWRKK